MVGKEVGDAGGGGVERLGCDDNCCTAALLLVFFVPLNQQEQVLQADLLT